MVGLKKILPENLERRKLISIGVTVLIAGILTIVGIYGIGQYGIALFIIMPLFIGAFPNILYAYGIKKLTWKESHSIAFLSLGICCVVLFICAIEGAICILMALPFAMFFTWLGSMTGKAIVNNSIKNAPTALFVLIASIPLVSFIEDKIEKEDIISITTSVEINASPEEVWRNVIEFPKLKEPNEFIFKSGIAYPISAQIEGDGVGAVRHCNFSTGSFIEPITIWREPELLKFDVADCPPPMKELSMWNVNAPHLHDYFVSKQGEFRITTLPSGKTLLEGTTWYYNKIKPVFYWKVWSNYIIHSIHERVLNHIKENSENKF